MKNTGKRLEQLVLLIQDVLKDSPNTKVYSNHKLRDTSGSMREIDVLIESVINQFVVKIAIECKEYKSPVSVEKVEAFSAKCSRIPEIHKKIFVSQSGYQSGAISAAKTFGIELYNIDNIPGEEILNWFPIKMLGLRFEAVKFELYLDAEDVEIEHISLLDEYVHFQDNKEPVTVHELINDAVLGNKNELWAIAMLQFVRDQKSILHSRFEVPCKLALRGVYLHDKNKGAIPIIGIEAVLEIFLQESSPSVIEANSYGIYNEEKTINHLAIDIGSNEKANFVLDKEGIEIVISDKNGVNTQLVHLGTYDPKTDKYTRVSKGL